MRFKILKNTEDIDYFLSYGDRIAVIDVTLSKDCKDLKDEVWYKTENIKLMEKDNV